MSNIEIINIESIYLENDPVYIILFYKNQSYTMIIERFGYHDFNYYYHGSNIPDKETQKEIEDYLDNKFLDYEEWNRLKNNQ